MKSKGFTIVETIVSIIILGIIATTVATLILLSNSASTKSHNKILATNLCNNSTEIFRTIKDVDSLSDYSTEFKNTMLTVLGYSLTEEVNEKFTLFLDDKLLQTGAENKKILCTFVFSKSNDLITLSITVHFDNGEQYFANCYAII